MERVNLAYITSCRWVDRYQESTLEYIAKEIYSGRSEFAQRFNLVCIICDDNEEQFTRAWRYSEIWSPGLVVPIRGMDGTVVHKTLKEMTFQIPAQPWKDLRRLHDEKLTAFRARKARCKANYEQQILHCLISSRADLILSDSYLTIFGPDLLLAYDRRILNVHPGITQASDPARIVGRTPTRDTYTRAAYGCIIVDDKRKIGIPQGKAVSVVCDGRRREAVAVEKSREAGVTVHIVTKEIDGGPIVLCERYFIEDCELSFAGIRDKNYRIKRGLIPSALLTYIKDESVIRLIAQGTYK